MFFSKNKFKSNKLKLVINKKKKINYKLRRYLFFQTNSSMFKFFLKQIQLLFWLPLGWDFIILRSRFKKHISIFFFTKIYYFRISIPINSSRILFDSKLRVINLSYLFINYSYNLYWNYVSYLFSLFVRPIFKKIKFKGKGYYIYKNKRNTITPQFGYAHRIYIYSYFVTVRFLSKTTILVFGFSKSDILSVSHQIKSSRPINIFTGRGVRFAKEIIYKKQGKVSSYR